MMLLIIAVELLAIVANLSLPLFQDMSLHQKAAGIAHEMRMVREASLRAHSRRAEWPTAATPGALPTDVAAQLPPGFQTQHDGYRLVWDHWSVVDGKELKLSDNDVAAVTVITEDPRLGALVAREFPAGMTRTSMADRTTLVVE